MGRPLFSTILSQQAPIEPIIHVAEPDLQQTTPTYERWSSWNSFDPDSDEFFAPENAVYEAFLTDEEVAAMREREEVVQQQQQQSQNETSTLSEPDGQQRAQLRRERLLSRSLRAQTSVPITSVVPPLNTTASAPSTNQTQIPIQSASPSSLQRNRLVQITTTMPMTMPELLSASGSSDSEDSNSEASQSGRASPMSPAPLSAVSATGRLRRQISRSSSENDIDDVDGEEYAGMPPLVSPLPNDASMSTLTVPQVFTYSRPDWLNNFPSARQMSSRVVAGQ